MAEPGPGREDRQDLSRSGISEQNYYRWQRLYVGLKVDQARRLKDLERENQRLKKAISELTLDKLILKEALEEKYQGLPAGERALGTYARGCQSRNDVPVLLSVKPRATQRRRPRDRDDEAALTSAIERLATQYGRYDGSAGCWSTRVGG